MADANLLREFLKPVLDEALAAGALSAAAKGYQNLASYLANKDLSLLFKNSHRKIFEQALHKVAGDKTPLLREMLLAVKTDDGFEQALLEFQISRERPAEEFLEKLFVKCLPAHKDRAAAYSRSFLTELREQIAANPKLFPGVALKMLDDILAELRRRTDLIQSQLSEIHTDVREIKKSVKKTSTGKTSRPQPVAEDPTPLDWRLLENIFIKEYRLDQLDFGHLETGERLQHKLDLQRVYIHLNANERSYGNLFAMALAGSQKLLPQQTRHLPRLLQRFEDILHIESEKNVRLLGEKPDKDLLKKVAQEILKECAGANLRECETVIDDLTRQLRQPRDTILRCLDSLCGASTVPMPLKDIVSNHRAQLFIGDAGCGKTTFLRFIALQAFADLNSGRPDKLQKEFGLAGPTPIPIYFRLEDFANAAPASLDELLACACRFYRHEQGAEPLTVSQLRRAMQERTLWLLLDGLDEISDADKRQALAEIVQQLATDRSLPNLRLTLTSRPAAISDDLLDAAGILEFRMMSLEQPQIEEFAYNYFAANLDESEAQSRERAKGFLAALDDVSAARQLATNPLLLTVIAVLHYRGGKLPRFRAELYEKCVEQLMTQKAKKPGQAGAGDLQFVFPPGALRKSDELLRVDYNRLTIVLRDLAYHAHARKDGEMYLTPALVKERLVDTSVIDKKWQTRNDIEKAALGFLNFCEQRVGLMAYRSGHFIFVHRTFQEYLAAHFLSQQRERPLEETYLPKLLENPAHWREVLRLFFGRMIKEQSEPAKYLFEAALLPACSPKNENLLALVAECLADMEERDPLPDLHEKTTEAIIALRKEAYEKPSLLLACGKALSVINEPLIDPADPPVTLFKNGGEFTMGASKKDDDEAYADETPHRVRLSPFAISRYPITNLQFAEFVQAAGYEDDQWWPEMKACKEFLKELRKNKTLHPSEWYSEKFGRERGHAPVVGVSWYEATAYCNWWTQHYADEWLQRRRDCFPNAAKVQMLLPTEAQWEFSARRGTGRKYPWGNEPLSPLRLNYDDKIKSTTEVGSYPQGATPDSTEDQKIFDMAGNVWEWCRDWFQDDFYNECLRRKLVTDPVCEKKGESRVVRGGSWAGDSPPALPRRRSQLGRSAQSLRQYRFSCGCRPAVLKLCESDHLLI